MDAKDLLLQLAELCAEAGTTELDEQTVAMLIERMDKLVHRAEKDPELYLAARRIFYDAVDRISYRCITRYDV